MIAITVKTWRNGRHILILDFAKFIHTISKMDKLIKENAELKKRLNEMMGRVAKRRKIEKKRHFDFSKYKQRNIALKFCYFGWNYSGLVEQENTSDTVLSKLYEAMEKTRIIEDKELCNLKVCGRTDKGVSGLQQVISMTVRTNLLSGAGVLVDSGPNIDKRTDKCDTEIDYAFLINRLLPKDIRVMAWAPVEGIFSARFSCLSRTYRYFFPRSKLDIEAMRRAAQKLVGEHDFRNFCTLTVRQGRMEYVRNILRAEIDVFHDGNEDGPEKMMFVEIQATGFLYHQIRFTMSVLFMVGLGHEPEEIVDQLLDTQGFGGGGKPSYLMASDLPLVFYDAEYDGLDWRNSEEALSYSVTDIEQQWIELKMRETIAAQYLRHLRGLQQRPDSADNEVEIIRHLCREAGTKVWRPLMNRLREPSLEDRIERETERQETPGQTQ